MKKKQLLLFALLSVASYGASVDHIQNYSAEYGGNPAQQGAVNAGSSVYFNPAGLMKLENGTYFIGGLQYAFGNQDITEEKVNQNYSTTLRSPIPNLALYKKTDENAYFLTFGAVGGGAELEYKNSIPLSANGINFNQFLKKTNVTGSNMYAQITVGKSYYLTDKWSASLALRGVYGLRTLKASTSVGSAGALLGLPVGAKADIDSERTATALGVQIGLNYSVNEKLNVGFRYDSKVNLQFETDANIHDQTRGFISSQLLDMYPVYKDGTKLRRDLPAMLALGASYKVNDDWTTFVGGNYYFNKDATMDEIGSTGTKYENGWELSIGSEYWINEKFAWLVGFNYADTGAPDKSYSSTEYAIDSFLVGTGVKYKQNETTEWTVAFNHYFYQPNTVNNIKYEKEISSVGINFVKKF